MFFWCLQIAGGIMAVPTERYPSVLHAIHRKALFWIAARPNEKFAAVALATVAWPVHEATLA